MDGGACAASGAPTATAKVTVAIAAQVKADRVCSVVEVMAKDTQNDEGRHVAALAPSPSLPIVVQTGVCASSLSAWPAAAAFFLRTAFFAFWRASNASRRSLARFCCASIFACSWSTFP